MREWRAFDKKQYQTKKENAWIVLLLFMENAERSRQLHRRSFRPSSKRNKFSQKSSSKTDIDDNRSQKKPRYYCICLLQSPWCFFSLIKTCENWAKESEICCRMMWRHMKNIINICFFKYYYMLFRFLQILQQI